MNPVALVAAGALAVLLFLTLGYCVLDAVLRGANRAYREVAEEADRVGVRWRYVLVFVWVGLGAVCILML